MRTINSEKPRSRTQKFLYNSVASLLLQVVKMLAGLITPRIILNAYGSEVNGLVSSIAQFIAYFNLVDAGLSRSAVFALYKPIADKDHDSISAIVWAAKKFYVKASCIFVSLVVGLSILYPVYIDSDQMGKIEIGILILLMGVNGILEMTMVAKYRALLIADQKTYVISLATICTTILNTILIIVIANAGYSVVFLRAVALLSVFSGAAILLIYCKTRYRYLNPSVKPNFSALKNKWDALFLQVLSVIHRSAPVVIITLVVKDLKIVSVYVVYNMVVSALNNLMEVFKSGLPSSFGEVIARGQKKTLQKSYKEFEFIYYLLITMVYAVAFVMIVPFVSIYTKGITDTNYMLPFVGALFVLDGLLYNLKTPQGMLVISAGMFKETKIQTIIQGSIVVVLGIVLAFFWGIYGVLIASIISNIYRIIDLIFFISKNVTHLPMKITVFRVLRACLSFGIIILPSFFIDFDISGYFSWVIYALCYMVYGCSISLIIGVLFEKDEVVSVIKRIRTTIRKKTMSQ